MNTTSPLQAAINEIAAFPLFSDLSKELILDLCEGGKIHVCDHRNILFDMDDPAEFFGIVLSGAFKLTKLDSSGEESIVYFCTPGDVIAALVMNKEGSRYPVRATAMGASRIVKISRTIYRQKWSTHPVLIHRVQSLFSDRISLLHNQKLLSKSSVAAKVAALLTSFQPYDIDTTKQAVTLPLPLTRKEIAENLGITVESVIRVMSAWAKKGYIESSKQQITILKVDKLLDELKH